MSQRHFASRLLRISDVKHQTKLAYVEKLGCAANRADGARVEAALERHAWRLIENVGGAHLVVVLTCGFTNEAEDFNRLRLAELARQVPDTSLMLIGGCLPGIAQRPLDLPVNAITFGPRDIDEVLAGISLSGEAFTPPRPNEVEVPADRQPTLVKVATGCGSRCAFCAIPMAAGRTRSRLPDEVVDEIRQAEASGRDWIRLTSEDFSAYGLDVGLSFVDLVRAVITGTTVSRITLDTLNPRWVKRLLPETVELLQDSRIDRRLYVPVQSGSSKVLKRMARGYDREDVDRVLTTLLADVPDARISTDFIVGFPGEEEKDFDATRELLFEYEFGFVEVFAYSERNGTAASSFEDQVRDETRKQRARILIADLVERQMDAEGVHGESAVLSFLARSENLRVNSNVSIGG